LVDGDGVGLFDTEPVTEGPFVPGAGGVFPDDPGLAVAGLVFVAAGFAPD
jgi:hypothetical protein